MRVSCKLQVCYAHEFHISIYVRILHRCLLLLSFFPFILTASRINYIHIIGND